MATTPFPFNQVQNSYGQIPAGTQLATVNTQQYYTVANYYTYQPQPYTWVQTAPYYFEQPVLNIQQVVWTQWNQQYMALQNQPAWVEAANQLAGFGDIGAGAARAEDEARKKARTLLDRHLTKAQRETLDKEGAFELQVNDRLYRVRPGSRVERINRNTKRVESFFCIHPETHHRLPAYDVALSQKLLLEADEKEFLRIANETRAA